MFSFITKKLWLHFMSVISLCIIIVLAVLIWNGIDSQNKLHNSQIQYQNYMLASAVEGGMFDALAIGDNDVVKAQFKRLNQRLSDLKVFVYDFNGKISFATDLETQGKNIIDLIGGNAGGNLKKILSEDSALGGDNSERGEKNNLEKEDNTYHQLFKEEPYTISNQAIFNESRCFHCHGSSRKVIGGITVCSSEALSLQNMEQSRNKSLFIGALGLIVIIAMIWVLFHYLVNIKISLITKISGSMSRGDFTNDIEVIGNNEISDILAGSRKMNKELKQMIKTVSDSCNELLQFSKELESISSNTLTNTTNTSDKSTIVAVAAEQMSANLSSIASSIEETSSNVNMIASASEEMHATAHAIAKSTGKAKETMEKTTEAFKKTAEVVGELGKAAQAIDDITDNIRDISEQVSLLALNAKIEAARAGDAGKGFAVVAAEISELAVATAKATLNVDETLKWMKEKADETVANIQIISKRVEDSENAINTIASAVEEQAATSQEIADNISNISQGIFQVNSNVSQGAAVSRAVAADIAVIDNAASKISVSTNSVNEKSIHLENMAENLMKIMKKFKVE